MFLIIFFVGGLLYVAGTVGFNFFRGKRGLELAPHPEFWKMIPGLIVDGFKFTKDSALRLCNRGGGGGGGTDGGGGYAKI